MKNLILLLMFVSMGYVTTAANTNYFVDDSEIEHIFSTSVENDLNAKSFDMANSFSVQAVEGDNLIVAVILDIFLGGWGIHRVYLGGKASLILIYFITCGGIFGIVPLVDLVVMALGDFDQFINNDKFIVWTGN